MTPPHVQLAPEVSFLPFINTCHGQLFSIAGIPPTILPNPVVFGDMTGTPQPSGNLEVKTDGVLVVVVGVVSFLVVVLVFFVVVVVLVVVVGFLVVVLVLFVVVVIDRPFYIYLNIFLYK